MNEAWPSSLGEALEQLDEAVALRDARANLVDFLTGLLESKKLGLPFRWVGQYRLEGRKPVPCYGTIRWATWMESADRRVARTDIGKKYVSTVFLGLDHNFIPGNPPLLYETMVFNEGVPIRSRRKYFLFGPRLSCTDDDYGDRYSTWEEAEAGHAAIVAAVEEEKRRVDAKWRRIDFVLLIIFLMCVAFLMFVGE